MCCIYASTLSGHQSHQVLVLQNFKDEGVVATPAVFAEITQAACALHANESTSLNLYWLNRDIRVPLDAFLDARKGYWRPSAGPGPRHEPWPMIHCHKVPAAIMSETQFTNYPRLIADHLYPFVDLSRKQRQPLTSKHRTSCPMSLRGLRVDSQRANCKA